MSAKEYRAMWRSYIKYFGYEEAKVEFQQGYAICKDVFPSGLYRVALELVRIIGFIKLQWYRLLHWGVTH